MRRADIMDCALVNPHGILEVVSNVSVWLFYGYTRLPRAKNMHVRLIEMLN